MTEQTSDALAVIRAEATAAAIAQAWTEEPRAEDELARLRKVCDDHIARLRGVDAWDQFSSAARAELLLKAIQLALTIARTAEDPTCPRARRARGTTTTMRGTAHMTSTTTTTPEATDGQDVAPYVIVRTYSAGCFAGELLARTGKEVTLRNARRLWYWKGAATLSQLAVEGTSRPTECKFPEAVPEIDLTEAIEVIKATPAARTSIESVPAWRA